MAKNREAMATMNIDDVKGLARRAHGDARVREGLFADIRGAERDAAVHAAWTLMHLPKSDNKFVAAHRYELVDVALATGDTSLRRITMALLERLEWDANADDTQGRCLALLDFCLERMWHLDESCGVRSLCIKLAYKISASIPELRDELRQNLLLMEPSELSPGLRHARKKTLQQL